MFKFTVDEVARACSAELVAGNASDVVSGVAYDSRDVEKGMLFVCIPGERVNGYRFAASAIASGAAAVVMTEEPASDVLDAARTHGAAVLRADGDDPEEFLLRLAGAWRDANPQWKVVGVTGSVGKTTTKELCAAALGATYRVHATAGNLNLRPQIGIRVKLASSGAGKWEESGGDASKFGLDSSDLLRALEYLREHQMEDCLKLMHFHIGSQITKIRRIQFALTEAAQFYVQLHKMGFNIEFVDCGGGLGVDYDGTRSSNSESSVNYSIQEYINDCVYTFVEASDRNQIPHPNLISEGGRSLSAHHSVLILEAFESTHQPSMNEEWEAQPDDHKLVRDLSEIWDKVSARSMLEDWHDAEQIREEGLDLFRHGLIDLKTRAQIESVYWSITREVNAIAHTQKHMPDELRKLDKLLADKYFCNFSLFQSMPDSWAIDQFFPIMPIHRLNEKPDHNGTLQDITCDSDGKIETFVQYGRQTNYLPLHGLKAGEPYYIGVFLVGAYQEILGNMHNLFGDTNAVHVSVGEDGSYTVDQIIDGETVADVLDYVQYDPKQLVRRLETWVDKAIAQERITPREGQDFIANFQRGLYGYTYLEN